MKLISIRWKRVNDNYVVNVFDESTFTITQERVFTYLDRFNSYIEGLRAAYNSMGVDNIVVKP